MNTAIAFGVAALILGAVSLRHATVVSAVAYLGSVAFGAVAVISCLGRPVPLGFVWPRLGDVGLLATVPDEPKAVYMWVRRDGDAVPLAVSLPWSEGTAAHAQEALDQAKSSGRPARWRLSGHAAGAVQVQDPSGGMPGDGGLNGSSEFYNSDISPLPPKVKS